jgi:hypothetical protein
MGTISLTKLGGYCLILGPVIATIFFLLYPGSVIIDAADPSNPQASIGAVLANAGLAKACGMLITLGILMLLIGIIAKQSSIKGNGETLARIAVPLVVISVSGIVLNNGLGLVIAGNAGAAAGAIYAASIGIGLIMGTVFALGIIALALAISTAEGENKIFALIIAAAGVVSVVVQVIAGTDSSQLQLASQINGVVYLITTIWTITLGLKMIKE